MGVGSRDNERMIAWKRMSMDTNTLSSSPAGVKELRKIGMDMPKIFKKFPMRRMTVNLAKPLSVSLLSDILFFLMYRIVNMGKIMLRPKQHSPYRPI